MKKKQPIKDPGKLSAIEPSELFEEVSILIADNNPQIVHLIKKLLINIGCRRVFTTSNGLEAIEIMREETIDILITEWHGLKAMNGLELCIFLRQSLDSPNRAIPIIILTAEASPHHINEARDAGVNEFLAKPFSAKALLERLYAIVSSPRGFVISKNFIGPDRRRVSSLTLPPDPDEKREFIARKPPVIVAKDQLQQLILDDTPRMVMPDYTLRKKIGLETPPEVIISDQTINLSEGEIENQRGEFLASLLNDIGTIKENYQTLITKNENVGSAVNYIKDLALSIQSRSGIFGYDRGSEIAGMLYIFCYKNYNSDNKNHIIVMDKLIQTIDAIFSNDIRGDGGKIGTQLRNDLNKLIEKYLYVTETEDL